MSSEILAEHIETIIQYVPVWGYLIIFVFMTIESSFIPFPSEVVMIPAGFLAYRGELSCHIPVLDLVLALLIGLSGSMAGAYINYFLAAKLGRPFFDKYGKYCFISPQTLTRADEIFQKYGEITTVVCRLLPAIRQLISLPAGLCRMNLKRFSIFTALGAGVWCVILLLIGWGFGRLTGEISYPELIQRGSLMLKEHLPLLIACLAVFVICYLLLQKFIMNPAGKEKKD